MCQQVTNNSKIEKQCKAQGMDTLKHQRQQLAKAILELHDLYISTGEEKKPMSISLPDLAAMADLPEDVTENVLLIFIGEKLIAVEKRAFLINNEIALIGIAYNKNYIMSLLFYVRHYLSHSF